jgi:hypothetical protein
MNNSEVKSWDNTNILGTQIMWLNRSFFDGNIGKEFINRIKNLNKDDIKKICWEDRRIINKIIDFYHSKEEQMCFLYFGLSNKPFFVIKKEDDGYDYRYRDFKKVASPPPSNFIEKIFKGLFNFFGRISSEELYKKTKPFQTERNGTGFSYYSDL